jgi:acetylornithine deacetylase/succinyl-diaminopimelate desuccinylase-like protein
MPVFAPSPAALEDPLVVALAAAHFDATGSAAAVGSGSRLGCTSDASSLQAGGIARVVEYGPGQGNPWPGADEAVRIDDIVTCAQVLAATAGTICA